MTVTGPAPTTPALARSLAHCVEACAEALARFPASDVELARRPVRSDVEAAVAAFQRVMAHAQNGLSTRTLQSAVASGYRAADRIRSCGLDEQFLRCAEALDRAAMLCEASLQRRRGTASAQT